MNPDEYPDEYISDIDGELDGSLRDEADVAEQEQVMQNLMCIHGAAIMLAKMVEDEYITLREYAELTDALMEYEREVDATVL